MQTNPEGGALGGCLEIIGRLLYGVMAVIAIVGTLIALVG